MSPAPLIKICGVRTEDDVDICLQEQVAYVGLNFYPSSPRYLPWGQGARLRNRLGPATQVVAVMVRPSAEEMKRAVHEIGVNIIQLHGLDEAYLSTFSPPGVPVWTAHGVATPGDVKRVHDHTHFLRAMNTCVSATLVDAKVEGEHGGTGCVPPWSLVASTVWSLPLVLAGGLTPVNVAAAVTAVRPFAVDVASGVERVPGEKDPELIRAFVRAARMPQTLT